MADRNWRPYLHPNLERRASRIHGFGIVATGTIRRGATILQHGAYDPEVRTWPVGWGADWAFNESCEPNAARWKHGAIALVEITPGEEVTIGHLCYLRRRKPARNWVSCNCGAPNCCGYAFPLRRESH